MVDARKLQLAGLCLLGLALGSLAYAWLRGVEERAAGRALADRAQAGAQAVDSLLRGAAQRVRLAGQLPPRGRPGLGDLVADEPAMAELLRFGMDGRVLDRAGGPPLLAARPGQQEVSWYLWARAGRPFVGQLPDAGAARPDLVLSLPTSDGGVVAARITGATLKTLLDAEAPDLGRWLLVDDAGRLLARSGDEAPAGLGSRLAGEPGLDLALAGGDDWSGVVPRNGAATLAAARRLPASWLSGDAAREPVPRWMVYVDAPRSALLPASRQLATTLALGLALLVLGMLGSALWRGERFAPAAVAPRPPGPASAGLPGDRDISREDLDSVLRRLDAMVVRAKEVDRLKSEFLATISHELRTPLNSVIGYAELILSGVNGPVDEETRQDVKAIHDNGQVLLRIVNDLLDLAKIEADRLELDLVQLDPAALLQDAAGAWRKAAETKGLGLTWEAEPGLPRVWGDSARLHQVLSNLLSNAIKFTEHGSVHLAARVAGPEIAIVVSDTGQGIAAEDRETIFERFRQLDGSFTRRAGGTGLGLAISRHLVRMHGGRIEVDSEPGRGAAFTVFLPVEEQLTHMRGRRVGPLLW